MLRNTYSNGSGHRTCRVMRRLALACSAVSALALMLATAALPQGRAPAFAGTWQSVDAVDDYGRAAVIVIRRIGDGYELIDPNMHPRLVLRGRATRGRLTFVQTGRRGTTTFVYTIGAGGNTLTEDRYSGTSHFGGRFVRVIHRPQQRRVRHRHS